MGIYHESNCEKTDSMIGIPCPKPRRLCRVRVNMLIKEVGKNIYIYIYFSLFISEVGVLKKICGFGHSYLETSEFINLSGCLSFLLVNKDITYRSKNGVLK